jgi:hypothetical protein
MSRTPGTNPLSGCLLYALATLPFTALLVMAAVWLERLGAWGSLWADSANVLCCFLPCLGAALPLGLMLHYASLRRGTLLHHLAQMSDRRGLGVLDACTLVGSAAVVAAMLYWLPPSNAILYLPAVLAGLAVAARWLVRNLIAVVPFDEQREGADLAALGQHSPVPVDALRDYNLPPPTLRISLGRAVGQLGSLQTGAWRLDVQTVSTQAGPDLRLQTVKLAGTVTNTGSTSRALAPLPRWVLRDSLSRETVVQQAVISPASPSEAALSIVTAEGSVGITLSFDAAAAERSFDLLARGRELAPGEEVVVPF